MLLLLLPDVLRYHNATAISDRYASVTLPETRGQRPIARYREPKSQHVPAAAGFRPVDETCAIVEQAVVVDELHVATREPHADIQAGVVCQRVEEIERFDMVGRQPRGIGKALRRIDVLALIHYCQKSLVPAEDGNGEEGLRTRRYLAAPVRSDVLEQVREQVGPIATDCVVDGHRAHQQRIAALASLVQAQQANHIRGVRVERLAFPRLIDAGIGIPAVGTDVADVTQQVSIGVLRPRAAKMGANAEEDRRRQLVAQSIDG